MSAILDLLRDQPLRRFDEGEVVIDQGDHTGLLYVLAEGSVAVTKDGVQVAACSEPGAIFGDLSALLGVPHTAAVRAVRPSAFHVVKDARGFLSDHAGVCIHLCELLARRLDAVNKYLVDIKQQFAGDNHLGLVDQVLDTLMHRQPKPRVTPRASTLSDPELAE